MSEAILFDDKVFAKILPFHLLWTADGVLERVSPAIRRIWSLNDHEMPKIQLIRPFAGALDPDWFSELTDMLLAMTCTSTPQRVVNGQLILLHDQRWLLCGLPPIGRFSDLDAAGLKLSDLPFHSGVGDALIAAEAAHVSLAESLVTLARLEKVNASLLAMNEAFGRFVPHAFLESLGIKSPVDAVLGTRASAETSVMFADLRNFTSISEKLKADEVFSFINRYLAQVAPCIRENGGFVVHYLGDGILALFHGSPGRAVQAAIKMQLALKEAMTQGALAAHLPAGTEVTLGIGLHFGLIEMGIVGESGRWDSSIISDTVNTASRVEGLTKTFGAEVLITGDLHQHLVAESSPQTRWLGSIKVKGRAEPVVLYEVLDSLPPRIREVRHANTPKLAAAIAALEAGMRETATEAFLSCLATDPTDCAAQFYLAECRDRRRFVL